MNKETLSDLRLIFWPSKIAFKIKMFFITLFNPVEHHTMHLIRYVKLRKNHSTIKTMQILTRVYRLKSYKIQKLNEKMDVELDALYRQIYVNSGISKKDFQDWFYDKR